jgi:hypothetical protein
MGLIRVNTCKLKTSVGPLIAALIQINFQKIAWSGESCVGRPLCRTDIVALDGLRALAVILVIYAPDNLMFDSPFPSGAANGFLAIVSGGGWIGVVLFFVLSSFLIIGILFDSHISYQSSRLALLPLGAHPHNWVRLFTQNGLSCY